MPWSRPQRKNGKYDPGQIGIVKMYANYAGLPDQLYRDLLHQYTGATSSTAPHLTQFHFDIFMPVLETYAHLAEVNGRAVGNRPARIRDWYYWRKRQPGEGMANSRQLHRIEAVLWPQLAPYLPPDHRAPRTPGESPMWYVHEIAATATGRYIRSLSDLRIYEANMVIEALKDRIRWALKSA